jgi:hypothetical protein
MRSHNLTVTVFALAMSSWSAVVFAQEIDTENSVLAELQTKGVTLSDGTVIQIPAPSFSAGMTATEEKAALKEVAGRYPVDQFTKDSRVAPFLLSLKSQTKADDKKSRVGQTLDLWFVAYGDIKEIDEEKLLKDLASLEKSPDSDAHELTAEELKKRDIEMPESTEKNKWQFNFSEMGMLNLVKVAGVTQMLVTRGDDAVVIAGNLDPRFAGDADFPNQWRSQERDKLGKTVFGEPQPYAGFGGYAKATQLQTVKGAILVEVHLAFNEPEGWFDGKNLLRTKLPLIMQTNIRKFRDTLANQDK